MAIESRGQMLPGLVAAADLSANQYHALRVTAAWTVNTTNAAGMACLGVLQNKPASGAAAEVMQSGITKAIAGAAISAGAEVMAGADGRIITAATAGSNVIGIALEAAGAANEVISIALNAGAAIV